MVKKGLILTFFVSLCGLGRVVLSWDSWQWLHNCSLRKYQLLLSVFTCLNSLLSHCRSQLWFISMPCSSLSQTLLLIRWLSFRPDKFTLQSGLLLIEKQACFQTVRWWPPKSLHFLWCSFMSSRLGKSNFTAAAYRNTSRGGGLLQQLCVFWIWYENLTVLWTLWGELHTMFSTKTKNCNINGTLVRIITLKVAFRALA